MKHWGKQLRLIAGVFGLLLLAATPQLAGAQLVQDRDFRIINTPLAVEGKGKIEVTEFFWYGCSHCFDFEPVLGPWVKKLPADVVFRRVPTIFPNNKWAPGAKLYYTLEAMGLTEQLHAKAFSAIHQERLRLDDDFVLLDWVAKQGVDKAKFKEVYLSFAVNARVQQARELTASSGINGVPAVIVQGRYQALSRGNYEDLLKVIDQLIARARSESGASSTAGKK